MDNSNVPAGSPPATPSPPPTASGGSPIRLAVVGLIGVVLALGIYYSPKLFIAEEKVTAYPALKVGGTSVVAVVAENRWKKMYRDEKHTQVDYESSGTTTGINNLIDGKYAIAFTHAPLAGEVKKKAEAKGDILQIPVLLCGVAPVYNVKELKGKTVNFTGEVLADIFLGKIKNWDDKAIKDINPGLTLPAKPIQVIHRDDSSGTTYLLTEFLSATSKAWRGKYPQPSSEITWETGTGAKRNLGIATAVYNTEGAIGYVDRLYTSYDEMVLDYGAVRNQSKDKPKFVKAEPETFLAALQGAGPDIHPDLAFSLTDKPGADAYPISGVIYAVCYQHQPDDKRQLVGDFLHWITHEGQAGLKHSKYAALPPDLAAKVDERLKMLK